jgi:hypothetical protein
MLHHRSYSIGIVTFLTLILLTSNTLLFAQKKAAPAPKCSGAWTGVITYLRTQSLNTSKTVPRVSNGEDKTNFDTSYNYKARVAVVESPELNGSSEGKATIESKMASSETVVGREKNSCDRGKSFKEMSGTFVSKSELSGEGQGDASVSVSINSDGTYTVSVGLPQIPGKTTGSVNSSFSGQCTPKEGVNRILPDSPATIEGNSLTSDGVNRIDPSDQNKLSGSYTNTWQGVSETITWNLQKCGAPLRLTDVEFEDMKYPNWNDWRKITEQTGTIDGNLVKIKAKVLNASGETKYADVKFKETYKGDKWDGAKPDAALDDTTVSVKLEPGEEKEVEMVWDSSGYAWYDDGRPRLVQRIKAELEENGKKTDEMTKNLKVAPKPIVSLHGLWSNWKVFETWQNILTTTHSYDWKAFPVGEKPEHGTLGLGGSFMSADPTKSIEENARVLQAYIKYAQEDRNAWHVDVVAHSIGGLIARQYIQNIMPVDFNDPRPKITHLVMLGTPNQGSKCAEVMSTAYELVGKNVEALRQLKPEVVNKFNGLVFNQKGVKFSALAGNPLPTFCSEIVWNDGFVSVPSATYRVKDHAESKSIHPDLTGTSDFSSFVKPHLAIGPKGDHKPAPLEGPSGFGTLSTGASPFSFAPTGIHQAERVSREFTGRLLPRLYGARGVDVLAVEPADGPAPPFAKAQLIAPKQTVDIEIPVEAAQNFGLTFMAAPSISVTLLNDKGVVAGKNLSASAEARGIFRSIFVNKPMTNGTWKLRVENTGTMDLEIVLTTWSNAGK